MTRFEARRMLLVLVAKGIPYKLTRRGGAYLIDFDLKHKAELLAALGA